MSGGLHGRELVLSSTSFLFFSHPSLLEIRASATKDCRARGSVRDLASGVELTTQPDDAKTRQVAVSGSGCFFPGFDFGLRRATCGGPPGSLARSEIKARKGAPRTSFDWPVFLELELELIQSHMAQKPVLRGEVWCACVAREVGVERSCIGERGCARRLGGASFFGDYQNISEHMAFLPYSTLISSF